MWNLDRLYWWTYAQGSNGDADIEKKLVNTGGEGEGGKNWESSTETYPLSYLKLDSGKLLYDSESSNLVLCDNLGGWDGVDVAWEVQEGGNICIPMANSCGCMAETDTIL